MTAYHARAWYYAPIAVNIRINATSPQQAMERLKEVEKTNDDFWADDEVCYNGPSGTTYEVRGAKQEPLLVEPGHELAPAGSHDVLLGLLKEMDAFDAECRETEYTDTDVVWNIFDRYRKRIRETLGALPSVGSMGAKRSISPF